MTEQKSNIYAPTEVRVDDVRTDGDTEPAGRLERLGAAIIDSLILGGILMVIMFFVAPGFFIQPEPTIAATMAISLVSFVLSFVLYAGINFMFLKNGQTVGKKLVGIKIVRTDGSPATVGRILFLRFAIIQLAAALIPIIGGIVGLVDVLLIFRESRKCLHDNIADTIVIKA